ncbi:MAG: hypothetical protein E7K14_05440 [Bacillota bacterium]|nr:hypothetical protein [Bacillota bacterium]
MNGGGFQEQGPPGKAGPGKNGAALLPRHAVDDGAHVFAVAQIPVKQGGHSLTPCSGGKTERKGGAQGCQCIQGLQQALRSHSFPDRLMGAGDARSVPVMVKGPVDEKDGLAVSQIFQNEFQVFTYTDPFLEAHALFPDDGTAEQLVACVGGDAGHGAEAERLLPFFRSRRGKPRQACARLGAVEFMKVVAENDQVSSIFPDGAV